MESSSQPPAGEAQRRTPPPPLLLLDMALLTSQGMQTDFLSTPMSSEPDFSPDDWMMSTTPSPLLPNHSIELRADGTQVMVLGGPDAEDREFDDEDIEELRAALLECLSDPSSVEPPLDPLQQMTSEEDGPLALPTDLVLLQVPVGVIQSEVSSTGWPGAILYRPADEEVPSVTMGGDVGNDPSMTDWMSADEEAIPAQQDGVTATDLQTLVDFDTFWRAYGVAPSSPGTEEGSLLSDLVSEGEEMFMTTSNSSVTTLCPSPSHCPNPNPDAATGDVKAITTENDTADINQPVTFWPEIKRYLLDPAGKRRPFVRCMICLDCTLPIGADDSHTDCDNDNDDDDDGSSTPTTPSASHSQALRPEESALILPCGHIVGSMCMETWSVTHTEMKILQADGRINDPHSPYPDNGVPRRPPVPCPLCKFPLVFPVCGHAIGGAYAPQTPPFARDLARVPLTLPEGGTVPDVCERCARASYGESWRAWCQQPDASWASHHVW